MAASLSFSSHGGIVAVLVELSEYGRGHGGAGADEDKGQIRGDEVYAGEFGQCCQIGVISDCRRSCRS
ncbi:hypothetical protein M0R45_036957 [Rubus argutus]|uniref:Uncharacterized protein n=1 Tax=Rubus argutus TaxID=59490 RepID=A0AAW1W2S8_RUBAR